MQSATVLYATALPFRLRSRVRDQMHNRMHEHVDKRSAKPTDRVPTGATGATLAGAGRATERRGSALILTLVLTLGLASLATSAIYLGSNARLVTDSYNRERDLRYAAEAVLAMGKSTLNYDPYAVPDTGAYRTVFQNAAVNGADGIPVPGVTTTMYIGRTSSNTGQFGAFVSVVAVAKNSAGAQVVRRLELAQESFAKFAYWSNQESNNGSTIYFNNNDQLWGPVWSNDVINIGPNGGAHFHDDVGTAATVAGPGYGVFDKGYSEKMKPIQMPLPASLSYLSSFAGAGGFNFSTPTSAGVDQVMTRIEFVAKPVDNPATPDTLNGNDDGFFRVYTASASAGPKWLRGDFSWDNCGARYAFRGVNQLARGKKPTVQDTLFVPLSEHRNGWFANALQESGFYTQGRIDSLTKDSIPSGTKGNITYRQNNIQMVVMSQPNTARCYMGGDPNLRAVNTRGSSIYGQAEGVGTWKDWGTTVALFALGGNDTTFTDGTSGTMGTWTKWPPGAAASVAANWPAEAPYLFPLSRAFNPSSKGVIYVNGTVGVSGKLRGRVTLYSTGNIAVLDDIRYVTDAGMNKCKDILGMISGNNIMLADNALNDPPDISSGGGIFKNVDDTPDTYVQGVLMALNTAFGAENYANGAYNASACEGAIAGRGCLYLTGGVIQQQRAAVGANYYNTYFTGYTKRYSYDHCALYNPPPYFPTTGRYTDNRYYELDPSGFDIKKLFATLQPN